MWITALTLLIYRSLTLQEGGGYAYLQVGIVVCLVCEWDPPRQNVEGGGAEFFMAMLHMVTLRFSALNQTLLKRGAGVKPSVKLELTSLLCWSVWGLG